MPAVSKAQKNLFQLALAVKKGPRRSPPSPRRPVQGGALSPQSAARGP